MRFRTLILRSLRFHWRGHLGVLLGAAVGSAALIGALVVGDSVRQSLRDLALQRLGNVQFAMDTGDRFFRSRLAELTESEFSQTYRLPGQTLPSQIMRTSQGVVVLNAPVTVSNRFASMTTTNAMVLTRGKVLGMALGSHTNDSVNIVAMLKLDATAAAPGGQARANKVQLFGVEPKSGPLLNSAVFSNLPPDAVILNQALAAQLKVTTGDVVTVRTRKPDALGGDSPLSPQDDSLVALRLSVQGIVSGNEGGNLDLAASQVPPFNAFVNLSMLQEKTEVPHRANLLLTDLPQRTYWQKPQFSWVQWLGEKLRQVSVNLIRPASPQPTHPLSPAESEQKLNEAIERQLTFVDLQLQVSSATRRDEIELRSSRVFLDPPITEAIFHGATNTGAGSTGFTAQPYGVLTYLVNLMRHGERSTPYSMVTAADAPLVPGDLKEDEIIISQWLADDLEAKVGAEIELSWFVPDQAAQLVEATNRFRVREILPMNHPALDRTLMPDFPGVAGAEKAGDWETGFPLVYKIRDQDDQYWETYRGTPKAFISLAAGQRLWSSRQGNLTAIRFPSPHSRGDNQWYLLQMEVERGLKKVLFPKGSDLASTNTASAVGDAAIFSPASLGFQLRDVRTPALTGANQSQDFGGLFIGFSFFLILAALILMALLFQFGLEQRTNEIGTLLALGLTPRRVRWLLLGEGIAVAFLGGVIGMLGGVGYAKAMLYGLTTLWRDAVGTSALHFHATPATLFIGLFASVVVCAVTIWIVLRKQARRPARELLAEGADLESQIVDRKSAKRAVAPWIAGVCGAAALGMIGWAVFSGDSASAGLFFGAGAMLLVAELAAVAMLISKLDGAEAGQRLSVGAMGLRNCTRRRSRSLASVALLACGSFLVAAIGANRLDSGRDATKRSSGTGGFAFFGESSLPVVRDLNTDSGRDFYSLDKAAMNGVNVVPFRVRDGDDASCLNLNRAQNPRLLGVKPESLADRKAFTFAKVLKGLPSTNAWMLLKREGSNSSGSSRGNKAQESSKERKDQSLVTSAATNDVEDVIPAIGDAASIQWALGKKLGDTIDYTDERGRKFKVRFVAGVANSILQGNLIIDEAEFTKRFPSENGHRMFLIDTPSNNGADMDKVSAALSRALQDVGLELTPTTQRLAAFNAVQNTYLNTFQVLGGLGLLLGSAGLGVVVLRNVLERRGELGLLQAVGFRRRSLHWMVMSEHGGLLWLGLAVGMTAALAAVLPALLAPGAELHFTALALTLAGVFASGLVWTWLAIRLALRGGLLNALRNE